MRVERFKEFQIHTANELSELYQLILKGWPDVKQQVPHTVREYWSVRDELSVTDGIICKGMRLVVPPSLRKAMLMHIHKSHFGVVKCKQRAREALYWPRMNADVEDVVSDCTECQAVQSNQGKEEMIISPVPEAPWIEVATDIFEFKGNSYLLTVDYLFKFVEVDQLQNLSSKSTITTLKRVFSTHRIPLVVRSDNGPQFSSREFSTFCNEWGIKHTTSSPHLPRSNGEVERCIQTIKRAWKKTDDKHLAILDYNTTPLSNCGLSPAQIAMSRRPRNLVPVTKKLLEPTSYNLEELRKDMKQSKDTQKENYDPKQPKSLPVLQP